MSKPPKRVQWKRGVKGSRLPPNTKLVTRSSRWGNRFDFRQIGRDEAVDRFERWVAAKSTAELRDYLAPLVGSDLACYCGLDQRCHADVLLRLANAPDRATIAHAAREQR